MSSTELRFWSRDDMLAHAVRRGRWLRWRRRSAAAAVSAAVAMAVLTVSVGWSPSSSHAIKLHVLNRPTTTTTLSAPGVVPDLAVPTTAVPPARGPGPSTTVAPRPGTAPAHAASRPAFCVPSDLTMEVTTDFPTYPQGMQVHPDGIATNRGPYTCHVGIGDLFVYDHNGLCGHPENPRTLDEDVVPGGQVGLAYTWSQDCTEHPRQPPIMAPAGHYTAVITLTMGTGRIEGSAGFDVFGPY